MKHRLPALLLAAAALLPLFAATAIAQERQEDTWYLRPRVGLSWYAGDNEHVKDFKFLGDAFQGSTFPLNAALEVGYKFSPKYQVGVALAGSILGNINDFNENGIEDGVDSGEAYGLQLIARRLFTDWRLAPFMQAGLALQLTNGNQIDRPGDLLRLGAGPLFGVGLDYAVTDRVSLALESSFAYIFGDAASDGADEDGDGDHMGWNTLALTYDLKKFVPVMVTDQVCPTGVVTTGEPTTFTGSVNPDASPVVSHSWNFGDGSTADGMTASHAFASAGTYRVTYNVSNGNGRAMDSRQCQVTIEDPCAPAEIVTMTASNMSPDTQTSVRFSSNVTGTAPVSYSWSFGDGSTATGANPTHTFSQPGTYTVTLAATNCGGTVSRTMTITVAPFEAAICREVEEMNSVFFARNSSTLTPEIRAVLQENLAILAECPNLNARIEGWAAPGERRPDELSLARARSVEQFYVSNGIAASRLVTVGMGRSAGMSSTKEGLSQFRRVDTIPVR